MSKRKSNGSGRPLKHGEPQRQYSINLPESLWQRVDNLASRAKEAGIIPTPVSRSDIIKQALEYLLPLAEAALRTALAS